MLRHALLLLTLCALAYLPGLTTHGLTNWQESVRLAAAREMHDRGDWIVPTIHGTPYLAKPPLIYWCQLAIARLRGADEVTLFDLRLTVALAGTLGVMLTWLAARRLLRDDAADDPNAARGARWAERAAFWSAAMLATGVLIARAARIGEIDILLVPFTALAVLAAWNAANARTLARAFPHHALAALAFALLALAKGPPGMLAALLTIAAGPTLSALFLTSRDRQGAVPWVPPALAAVAAFVPLITLRPITTPNDVIGVAFFALAAAGVAAVVSRLVVTRSIIPAVLGSLRTAWPLHAIVGVAALWAWGRAVGPQATAAASREADDNLAFFVLSSPARGLEVFAYGAGLGSIAAIIALLWIVKDRPRLPRGLAWALAWAFLSLVVYSAMGRGAHRYLLPMLPAVSILGGAWLASFIRDVSPRLAPRVAAAIVTALAVAQGLWYGFGREALYPQRSPRDFLAQVRAHPGYDAARVASLDIWSPAFDVYAGGFVTPYTDTDATYDYPHPVPPLADLLARLTSDPAPLTLLLRDDPAVIERLAAQGLRIDRIPTTAPFAVDEWRTPMAAVRVTRAALQAEPPP